MKTRPNAKTNIPNVKIAARCEHLACIGEKAQALIVILLQPEHRKIHLDTRHSPDTAAQWCPVRTGAYWAQRAGFEAPDATGAAGVVVFEERQFLKVAVPVTISDVSTQIQNETADQLTLPTCPKRQFVVLQITCWNADFCGYPSKESTSWKEDTVAGVFGKSGRKIEIKIIRVAIDK